MNAHATDPVRSLDPEVIASLRDLTRDVGPELFTEILATFRDDLSKYVSGIQQGLRQSDACAVKDNAHAMKGASVNTGALALGGISARVEAAAESGDLATVSGLLAELEAEIDRVRADIALELLGAA
jgi:HPt (histidine-containing phosphotransfer) domain-containing protein